MKQIKIIILLAFVNIFAINICFAEYHKVNEDETEIATSTAQELELKFPERESGKLANEISGIDDEEPASINIINYKKPYFWALLFSLILILGILIRLFKKLSHMDREFKIYENKIKLKDKEVSENDEIIYSIDDTKNIKPISETENKIPKIKITKNIEEELPDTTRKKINAENDDEDVDKKINIKEQNEEDDDYIFEE
ncbi:MAG: hypothetical protein PHH83_02855 [Patescibacteria group bacterium]|nr:hypothetical protein [Patescibacteria group bacterium]